MYSGFLGFFNKSVQYDIYGNDYRTFVIAFGGMQFGKGLFTALDKSEAFAWEKKMARAFPERKGSFRLFGYDWMGRFFAVPAENEDKIIVFDPGVFDVYEVGLDLREFVNKAIPMSTNDCLASDAFIQWYDATGEVLKYSQCAGYKVPLFLGGVDEIGNFEVSDMDVYWEIISQTGNKLSGVEEGTVIDEFSIEDETAMEMVDDDYEEDFYDEEIEDDEYFVQQAVEAEDFFIQQKKRADYIRRNVDRYLEKFKKMHINNSNVSWNWCGFLFSTTWLLYRKMYGKFIITSLILLVIGGGVGAGLAAMGIDMYQQAVLTYAVTIGPTVLVSLVIGMFGNSWYRKKIDKLIDAEENAETEEEADKIYKKGGVNIPLMVIFAVLSIAYTGLMFI